MMPASGMKVELAGMACRPRGQGAASFGDLCVIGRVKPHFQVFGSRDRLELRVSRPGQRLNRRVQVRIKDECQRETGGSRN